MQRTRQASSYHALLLTDYTYTLTTGADSDAGSEAGAMIRQGSKLSYGSNDSGGSGSSAGAPKVGPHRVESFLSACLSLSVFAQHWGTQGRPHSGVLRIEIKGPSCFWIHRSYLVLF